MSDTQQNVDVDSPVSELPGIGQKRAEMLADLGIETVGELCESSPKQMSMWTEMFPGTAQNIFNTAHRARNGELDTSTDSESSDESVSEERDDEGTAESESAGTPEANSSPGEDNPTAGNVLLLGSDDHWEDKYLDEDGNVLREEVGGFIEFVLEKYHVRPKRVGWMAGDKGGRFIEHWVNGRNNSSDDSETLGRKRFDVDEDAHRSLDGEVNWYAAFHERDMEALRWADHVVILEEANYTWMTVNRRDELGTFNTPSVDGPFVEHDFDWKSDDDDDDQETLDTFGDEGDEDVEDVMQDPTRDATREEAGHVWVADDEREQDDKYRHEGGVPGDNTLVGGRFDE